MPLSFYGQYVKNNDAVTDADTAWLVGAKSKVFGLNLDYNYPTYSVTPWSAPSPTPTSPTAPPVPWPQVQGRLRHRQELRHRRHLLPDQG
jgi:hypothetical protein